MHPTNSWLKDADYSIEEENDIYTKQLQHIIDNPGLYLEAVEANSIREYKVRWKDYRYTSPTLPYEYTYKGKMIKNNKTLIKTPQPSYGGEHIQNG